MAKRDPELNGKLADAMRKDSRTDRSKLPKMDSRTQAAIQKAQAKGRNQQGWLGEN